VFLWSFFPGNQTRSNHFMHLLHRPGPFFALTLAALLWAPSPPPATHASPPASSPNDPTVATFSIVARDPGTGEIGVAVQSKVLGVGAIVPYVKAGAGAIATQAAANVTYGPDGLKLLVEGKSAGETLKTLTDADKKSAIRQVAIIAPKGSPATFTGDQCMAWAGGKTGADYAVQGNILAGQAVVDDMATAFENTKGALAERMLAALDAGQAAGGDRRGMQSAAILVSREGWGYAGENDRYIDLRVDDHATPIKELQRLLELHKKLFGRRAEPKKKPEGQ
jgi:uncharacterized Ntn-hydrolase superfamily protein